MIPPVVMYVLGAVLGVWGAYRVNMGRKKDAKGRGSHLFFGVLYILMAAYLILTTARVIPPPRLFGGPPPQPTTGTPIHVVPLQKIPPRPVPASAPAAAPASAPTK
jgi:hypothetical protein